VAKQSKRRKAPVGEAAPIHIHEEGMPTAPESRAAERAGLNKSEEIRRLAREMQGRGEKPRPVTIVKALAARGITVSSPQVSIVLKREGVERRPRRPRTSAPAASAAATSFSSGESFTVHQLLAAKKFVEMVGSPRQALALLDALDKIS
jgi:hypothetical protein